MKINDFIPDRKIMSQEEAEYYFETKDSSEYQIIDVRQPAEYEQGHLPGAILVPLDKLVSGEAEIEKKPSVLYCHSGKRSGAAARLLIEMGHSEIYDLGPSILTMSGEKIVGGFDYGVELVSPDIDYKDAFEIAWKNEEGLFKVYTALSENDSIARYSKFFKKMAQYEESHQVMIKKEGDEADKGEAKDSSDKILEVASKINSLLDVFSACMTFEAHSFDLYIRLANKAKEQSVKDLFYKMADEEKQHLNIVSNELDKYLKGD